MRIYLQVDIVPAYGGHPGLILILNELDDLGEPFHDYPETIILPGAQPPGDHVISTAWDGISGFDAAGVYVPAGDVNDDDVLDMWVGAALLHGPFLGKQTDPAQSAAAWIEGPSDGPPYLAGFDADGDGAGDVLFVPYSRMGIVRYGPFDGAIPSYVGSGFNPANTSKLGDQSGCLDASPIAVTLLPEQFGPGEDGLAITSYYTCDPDTVVYNLSQPRGSTIKQNDAPAWNEGGYVLNDAGDLDGDGSHDVFASTGVGQSLFKGPVAGFINDLPAPLELHDEIGPSSGVERSLGDLNGDGMTEFLVQYVPQLGDPSTWAWVVLFSPYDESPAVPRALELGKVFDLPGPQDAEWVIGDLDGDGMLDVLNKSWSDGASGTAPELVDAGELSIWYGSQLATAYADAISPESP